MKVYLLEDCPQYEGSTLVAVFADKSDAERRLARLQRQRRRWLDRQKMLEEKGSSEAWSSRCPHLFDNLCVSSANVVGKGR